MYDEGQTVSCFFISHLIYLVTAEVGKKNAPASDCNKSKGKCYGDPADGYNNGSNKSSSWGKIH